jgi:hypothetical protein
MTEATTNARRRWNDPACFEVPVTALWDFHYRNEAGGVCRAMPRAFLHARLWCDHVPQGAFGHLCGSDPGPHELVVCVLRNDNPSTYDDLLLKLRATIGNQ